MVLGLCPNLRKLKIAGIGWLQRWHAKVALTWLKGLDLTKRSIKILGAQIFVLR